MPGRLEGNGDSQHVHEIEGVAPAAGKSDPGLAEEPVADGAIKGRQIRRKNEKRKPFQGCVDTREQKDRGPADQADDVPGEEATWLVGLPRHQEAGQEVVAIVEDCRQPEAMCEEVEGATEKNSRLHVTKLIVLTVPKVRLWT